MSRTAKRAAWVCLALVVASLLVIFRDAIPGTLTFNERTGFWGTGTTTFNYKSGALMGKETYFRGKCTRAEWFRPDGTSIEVTEYKDGKGEGLYLRQDGSIWSRRMYVNGLWDGPCTYYNRDGSVLGTAMGVAGVRVSGYDPEPGEREK